MSTDTLVRFSAVAAIVGGALRVADGLLVASAASQIQDLTYFFTDLMILFGMCGIYLTSSHRLGLAGLLGFGLSFLGWPGYVRKLWRGSY